MKNKVNLVMLSCVSRIEVDELHMFVDVSAGTLGPFFSSPMLPQHMHGPLYELTRYVHVEWDTLTSHWNLDYALHVSVLLTAPALTLAYMPASSLSLCSVTHTANACRYRGAAHRSLRLPGSLQDTTVPERICTGIGPSVVEPGKLTLPSTSIYLRTPSAAPPAVGVIIVTY